MTSIPFITIFTAPKPFTDPHIATIQRNAIQSWIHLGPEVEVLLVGDEPGMDEVAREYGLRQIKEVMRSENGTPLVSSIFSLARQASQASLAGLAGKAGMVGLLAYLNADVMVLPDFVEAARQVAECVERFLIIGQRWDLDVRDLLDFSPGWDGRLRADVEDRGRLHLPAGSDYFIFPRDLFAGIPDFAIGRAGWDNWMIFHARQQGWPVIDATPSIMVIHQDHDYRHLPDGRPHYEHPESQVNQALAGGSANLYMVLDSDRQLVHGQVRRPKLTLLRLLRLAEVRLTPPGGQRQGLRWKLARLFRRLRRRITGSLE